jgi:ADP-ribose pyrophosphatase YjhB (NUDIX family)
VTARFCLRCGAALRTRREGRKARRACPRCGWTFYGNPAPAAVAALVRGDRVLLSRRARPPHAGTWDLPGGFLEAGETPEGAVRRELAEELGIRVGAVRLLGAYPDRYGPGGVPVLTMVFEASPGRGRMTAKDDVSEVRWFPLAALPLREIAFPSVRVALREVVARRRSARRPRARRVRGR